MQELVKKPNLEGLLEAGYVEIKQYPESYKLFARGFNRALYYSRKNQVILFYDVQKGTEFSR